MESPLGANPMGYSFLQEPGPQVDVIRKFLDDGRLNIKPGPNAIKAEGKRFAKAQPGHSCGFGIRSHISPGYLRLYQFNLF